MIAVERLLRIGLNDTKCHIFVILVRPYDDRQTLGALQNGEKRL